MTNTATETRSVVVEREIPFPPEKIWRALTQPHLIEEWLMKNDFKPVVGGLRDPHRAPRLPAGAQLHALQRDRLYRAERAGVLGPSPKRPGFSGLA